MRQHVTVDVAIELSMPANSVPLIRGDNMQKFMEEYDGTLFNSTAAPPWQTYGALGFSQLCACVSTKLDKVPDRLREDTVGTPVIGSTKVRCSLCLVLIYGFGLSFP